MARRALEAWELTQPTSPEEAADVVRRAARSGLAVWPCGSGSRLTWRTTAAALEEFAARSVVCRTGGLARVREVSLGNLTATFEAGCTMAAVAEALGQMGLWVPLESADGFAQRTVGGMIATAAAGPRRLGYGRPRDHLLGLEVVTAAGDIVQVGGKTVKNVSGYDLVKLLCGSWGTLGLITAATVRVHPLPERSVTVHGRYPDADAALAAVLALLQRPGAPVAAELVGGPALRSLGEPARSDADVALITLFEGGADDVEAALPAAREQLGKCAQGLQTCDGPQAAELWRRMAGAADELRPACRLLAAVPPDGLAHLLRAVGREWAVLAHAGNGIARLILPGAVETSAAWTQAGLTDLARTVCRLRSRAESLGGFLLVEEAPPGLDRHVPFRAPRASDRVERAIRAALDPDGVFSPHR